MDRIDRGGKERRGLLRRGLLRRMWKKCSKREMRRDKRRKQLQTLKDNSLLSKHCRTTVTDS